MTLQLVMWSTISWVLLVAVARVSVGWHLPSRASHHSSVLTVANIEARIARERRAAIRTEHHCSPGPRGNCTPVSSVETAHRRRCIAASWEAGLEVTCFG